MDPSPPTDDPLGPERLRELEEANERLGKSVMGSARVATFNGWTLGIFGGLSVLAGVLSPTNLLVGAVLLAIAWNEFRGRAMVRRLDPGGPRVLGWNQVVLTGVVFLYCAWSGWKVWARPDPSLVELETLLGLDPGEVGRMALLMYAVVFVVTAVILGLTARYHFVRAARLEHYREDVPGWILDIQRSTGVGR